MTTPAAGPFHPTKFTPARDELKELSLLFDNASILVTGGTGSFGKAFIKRVLAVTHPKRLIVFSRDELKQHEMQNSPDFAGRSEMRFFIGDVRDVNRLKMAMRGVDVVVHAAAMKQITTAEYNPFECVHTNIIGAENVVSAAIECKVKHVVALSTDKAVNPVSLYGASKLASDKIFVAANNIVGTDGTKFSVVRYGNVIGSRGSVVPLFRSLISRGATEMPITHLLMTRFWITLSEGADFVLSSLLRMRGGEIFVPKIPSLKIVDLADAMAPGAGHKVIGIRPGEKLHEVMITEEDSSATYDLGDRYVVMPTILYWEPKPGDFPDSSRRVKEGFRYSSDSNADWLDKAGLDRMLSDC